MAKTNTAEPEEKTETGDAPLIDLNEANIKKLIARAKKRGYITYDELNDALPQDQMSSEQIEDVMSALSARWASTSSRMRKRTRTGEKEDDPGVEEVDGAGETFVLEKKKETVDRTDDPVRMYLREMGAVELLSREGEIAIAKRIEAGRDTMIWGLCESPITFNAIIDWSTALNNGHMQLREILDLEAMLSKGPTAEQVEGAEDDDDTISESTAGPSFKEEEEVEEAPPEEEDEEDSMVERRAPRPVEEEDEDNTLCLAQMEETLKPAALEKFAAITGLYKKFAKLQLTRMDAMSGGQEFARRRREEISEASRAAHRRGRERPVPRRQDRISGRPALQLQPPADHARRPDAPPRRAPQGAAPRLPRSLYGPRARRGLGRAGLRHRQEMDRLLRGREPARSSASAPRSARSARRPACASASSAGSSTRSRRASARRGSPRRRWSRRTCAWSSRSPRNTPTAACSSSI